MVVVRWLHLLAMAFFVGWQMMLAAVVVPVGRCFTDRESLRGAVLHLVARTRACASSGTALFDPETRVLVAAAVAKTR